MNSRDIIRNILNNLNVKVDNVDDIGEELSSREILGYVEIATRDFVTDKLDGINLGEVSIEGESKRIFKVPDSNLCIIKL